MSSVQQGNTRLSTCPVCLQLCSICVPCCPWHGWGGWGYSQVFVEVFRDSAVLRRKLSQVHEEEGYSEPVPDGTLSLCQSCLVKKSKVCPVSGEHRVPLHPSGKGMVALILLSPEHLPELQFHIFCTGHSTWAHFSRLSFPSWKVIVEKVKTVIGPRIWVLLQNWNLLFFFLCWFILNQLVKLTPCHNKLGRRYLQDM